jgi:hypothetical protein
MTWHVAMNDNIKGLRNTGIVTVMRKQNLERTKEWNQSLHMFVFQRYICNSELQMFSTFNTFLPQTWEFVQIPSISLCGYSGQGMEFNFYSSPEIVLCGNIVGFIYPKSKIYS